MSDQTGLENNPQTETTPTLTPQPPAPQESERNRTIHSFIALCSLGIMGCFFMPWISFLFGTPSGYQLQQIPDDKIKLVWLIPGIALVSLIAAVTKKGVVTAAQAAGAMPFLALLYYRIKLGEGIFQALQIGAYITLALGAVLFITPWFMDKRKP